MSGSVSCQTTRCAPGARRRHAAAATTTASMQSAASPRGSDHLVAQCRLDGVMFGGSTTAGAPRRPRAASHTVCAVIRLGPMPEPTPALTTRAKTAVRAARAARTVDLGRVADSVGMIRPELEQALRGAATRGVCDAAMRTLMASPGSAGLVLTPRSVWVPAVVRASQPPTPTAADWLHADVGCCTASVAMAWSHSVNVASHRLAATSPRCPPGALVRLAQGDGTAAATRAVSNPACPAVLLRRSAWDQRSYLRAAAAANPSCASEVLSHLAADPDAGVRAAVAANPGCVPGDLVGLATDASTTVRSSAAANPGCDPGLLARLATDPQQEVRSGVARNPVCPQDMLVRLAADRNSWVRRAAARNPSCSLELLGRLAADSDSFVRKMVPVNAACPQALLEVLTLDEEVEVSEEADAALRRRRLR